MYPANESHNLSNMALMGGGVSGLANQAAFKDKPRPRDVSSELASLQEAVTAINMTASSLRERLESVMRTVAPVGECAAKSDQSPSTKLGSEIRCHHTFLREIDRTLRDVLDRLEI